MSFLILLLLNTKNAANMQHMQLQALVSSVILLMLFNCFGRKIMDVNSIVREFKF